MLRSTLLYRALYYGKSKHRLPIYSCIYIYRVGPHESAFSLQYIHPGTKPGTNIVKSNRTVTKMSAIYNVNEWLSPSEKHFQTQTLVLGHFHM